MNVFFAISNYFWYLTHEDRLAGPIANDISMEKMKGDDAGSQAVTERAQKRDEGREDNWGDRRKATSFRNIKGLVILLCSLLRFIPATLHHSLIYGNIISFTLFCLAIPCRYERGFICKAQ